VKRERLARHIDPQFEFDRIQTFANAVLVTSFIYAVEGYNAD